MDFRTKYDRTPVHSVSGDREVPIYGYVKNKHTGEDELKQIGKKDQYAEIQSFADSVDLNLLLARFTNGDLGALDRRSGFYGDVVDAPSSFREVLDAGNFVRGAFEQLSAEEKAKFGDVEGWLAYLLQADPVADPIPAAEPEAEGKEDN